MFGVIASSTTRLSPNSKSKAHYHHHHSTPLQSELEHNCEVSNAKNIQDKERETFLSYGIFNMVAGKRTAELLHKQHKNDQPHRLSNPDICGLADLCASNAKHGETDSVESHGRQRRHKQSQSVDLLHLIGHVNSKHSEDEDHNHKGDKMANHEGHHSKSHTHDMKEHSHKTKRMFHKTKK